ncbi:MAG: aspartate aminotransferase family protein [Abditibacteriales bacterium]|nr:aspartate aminotransferase family protein [Abditibacteriales bacterium]MDW8365728.1 aspartate aminotransferase family protein [Abditibacteriales bacterium]
MLTSTTLFESDRYLLHPLHHPSDHAAPLMLVEGRGVMVKDADGREYIDALAGLWNVLVGHGRVELAQAAAEQMKTLAYCSSYVGLSNAPAAALAARLAGFAYPNLHTTFFTCGGAEANESAFKTARCYWKLKGKPNKVKIISRWHAYHGVTLAAMSATGMANYWKMFEPRVPHFIQIPAPYPYRFEGARDGESVGAAAARMLEEAIQSEGADTVAAFIAEPVMGAGGVIVPPDDYFPRVREICDKYEVLFIADEVITGFGRTGKWFGLQHWNVQPDIMSFAKGITSGYLPLGGMQISDEIRDTLLSAPPDSRWMHAYTYSAHPTCCAVALKNLDLLERENLVARAATMGAYLQSQLQSFYDFDCVGEVRGLGLMAAVEFVKDRQTKSPAHIGERVLRAARERGVICRVRGDVLLLAPPLIITEAEVDRLVVALREAIREVMK